MFTSMKPIDLSLSLLNEVLAFQVTAPVAERLKAASMEVNEQLAECRRTFTPISDKRAALMVSLLFAAKATEQAEQMDALRKQIAELESRLRVWEQQLVPALQQLEKDLAEVVVLTADGPPSERVSKPRNAPLPDTPHTQPVPVSPHRQHQP
jgi:cell division protein ZapA (FtsZ GTPase activity inhibitor)